MPPAAQGTSLAILGTKSVESHDRCEDDQNLRNDGSIQALAGLLAAKNIHDHTAFNAS